MNNTASKSTNTFLKRKAYFKNNKIYLRYPINKKNVFKSIFNNYDKKYLSKLLQKHINICLGSYPSLNLEDFDNNAILFTIKYLYENEYNIADGINLAKMSNDRSLAGYRIPEWKKKFMRRNWEKLANFTKDNNIILVLRDIIFKNPKDTEKKINFLELLKNKVLWLSSDNRMIDDLVVIIISNIMSILLNKEYLYVSNDNFSDHLNFINRISNINTRINPKILSYCPIRGYYF